MSVQARGVVWSLVAVMACGSPSTPSVEENPAAQRKGRSKAKAKTRGKAGRTAEADAPKIPKGEAPDGAPNVLVVVMDTTRADHLTPYGYGLDTTPKLQDFAKGGVVYERAVSPGMWTLPSHASIFTGLPVREHGANAQNKWLDDAHVTMAEWFGQKGWDTWLFSANPYLQSHTNLTQGFDGAAYPWDNTWKGKAKRATMDKLLDNDASNALGPAWKQTTYPTGRANDQVKDAGPVAAEALFDWVDGREAQSRPWLAVVNYMEAHVPRIPSQASREALFDQATIDKQLSLDQAFPFLLAYTVQKHEFEPDEIATIASTYDASLRDLDDAVGAVFEGLASRKMLDNTIVVVTADHGEHLGEHHRIGHKYSVYNPLVRVPLIVRYPSSLEAGRVDRVVSTLDIFGTVTDLAGIDLPDGTRSQSLRTAREPAEAVSELIAATPTALKRISKVHKDLDWDPWLKTYISVETDGAKCIRRSDGHTELYDVPTDPLETADVSTRDAKTTETVCGRIDHFTEVTTTYQASGEAKREAKPLDPEVMSRLEALGYLQEEP